MTSHTKRFADAPDGNRRPHKKAWWLWAEGHVWKAAIYSRAGKQRHGCPVCAGVVNGKRKERYEKMLTEVQEVMLV